MTESESRWTASSRPTLCQKSSLSSNIDATSATPTTSPKSTETVSITTQLNRTRRSPDSTRPAWSNRRRSSQQSALDGIQPERWAHFPRLSTVLDDSAMASAHARFDSLKFSNDELLETSSIGYSSDEESIVAARSGTRQEKVLSKDACTSPHESGNKLQRAMSSSSARAASSLRRMGTTLRRAPSLLLSKPKSFNTDRQLNTPEPILRSVGNDQSHVNKPKKRRQSLADAFSHILQRGKENRDVTQVA